MDAPRPPAYISLIPASAILALGLIGAGWLLGQQIKQTRLADRYVTVRGLVERTVKSDVAIWNLSFRSSGNDFTAVFAASDAQKAKVLAFLKAQNIPGNAIQVGSPRVIDKAAQEYSGGTHQANEARYIVVQTLMITSHDVDHVAAATQQVNQLLRQGVILGDMQPGLPAITYKFDGLNTIKPDMISEATKNARAAAQRFANDSGAEVGAIRQASQGAFSISPAEGGSAESAVAEDAGGSGMPSDTSIMKRVRVVTTVEYFLEK